MSRECAPRFRSWTQSHLDSTMTPGVGAEGGGPRGRSHGLGGEIQQKQPSAQPIYGKRHVPPPRVTVGEEL